MHHLHRFQPSGFWLVTAAAVTWGTIGVATQTIYSIDTTSSLFINLARMVIAAPLLMLACWRVLGGQMFKVGGRDLAIMVLSGTLLALSQAAYFAAIRHTGVTIATLLTICISPLVVTGVSVLLKFETLTRRILIALACALVGSILLVGLGSPGDAGYDLQSGTIFSVIAALGYAGMILCGRFVASDYHPLQVTAINFGAGAVVLLVINLVSGIETVHTAQGWVLVAYLGLVPTALAYWLFQAGLRSVSATAASIVSMLDPLVAALLAWALFGERLVITGVIGGALLMMSIFLLSVERK